jgi:protein O-GlcNAc transferase
LLLAESPRQRHQITETFVAAGIDPSRIDFTTHRRRGEYLRLYDQIDVCLDPRIYNGITTTLDALWMSVPVLTLPGQTAPARAGLSILSNLEVPELIARDDAHFVCLATDLAADFPHRSQLRATLRDRMLQSPIMDAPRFTRSVESAYCQMIFAKASTRK